MNKRVLALLLLGALVSGCVFHRGVCVGGVPPGHARKAAHVHGHACGHVFVHGVWVIR